MQTQTVSLGQKFRNVADGVRNVLIERDEEVDMLFTALLCREHACLVGAAGTAKSMAVDAVVGSVGGALKFDILMSKFTDPVETEGPLDVERLIQGEYSRHNVGYMTTAHIIFMDEVFKASSAILNTTLKLINERKYRNSGQWHHSPLISLFGASNEWPVGDDHAEVAQAFFDRFLLRKHVGPICTSAGRNRLRWADDQDLRAPVGGITLTELEQAQGEAAALPFPKESRAAFNAMVRDLNGEGISPGDRRERKAVKAVKATAWMQGAEAVGPEHMGICSHIMWTHPDQMVNAKKIVGKHSNPDLFAVEEIRSQAMEVIANLDKILGGAERLTDTTKLGAFLGDVNKLADMGERAAKLRKTKETSKLCKWLDETLEDRRLQAQGIKKKS